MIDLVKYISLSVNSIFDEIDYGLFHMEGLDRKKPPGTYSTFTIITYP